MIFQSVFLVISSAIVILYLVVFLLSTGAEGRGEPIKGRVNVVVPTYNEAETIAECLESLLGMEAQGIDFRIHVIDDNSPDGTSTIVSRFAPSVSLIERPTRSSKADALNYVIHKLEGDVFAVVDADCIVEKSWLSGLVLPLANDRTGISTGSVLVKNRHDSVWTRLQSCGLAFLCHQLTRPVERVGMLYSINGNNFAFTRECWEKVGGFDPSKLTEDTNFAIRSRVAGLQIKTADAKVFTRVPVTLGDLLRQRRRWYLGWYQDLSSASLLVGAIFLMLFYYAIVFFVLSFSVYSLFLLLTYYLELGLTYRGAYGKIDLVSPIVFIILAPFLTTATILTALPSALKGGKGLSYDEYW